MSATKCESSASDAREVVSMLSAHTVDRAIPHEASSMGPAIATSLSNLANFFIVSSTVGLLRRTAADIASRIALYAVLLAFTGSTVGDKGGFWHKGSIAVPWSFGMSMRTLAASEESSDHSNIADALQGMRASHAKAGASGAIRESRSWLAGFHAQSRPSLVVLLEPPCCQPSASVSSVPAPVKKRRRSYL
eukprot:scaffold80481_cov32-Tisochrysis_lutea.AAC.1